MFFCTFLLTLIFSGFGYAQTVATDKDDYAPGEYVIITGTGWKPGEKVVFTFEEDPKPETCVNSHDFFTYASGAGEIYYDEFLIKENHVGVAFVLTALGSDSNLIANAYFTDANSDIQISAPEIAEKSSNITISAQLTQKGNQSCEGCVGQNNGISGREIFFYIYGTYIGEAKTNSKGFATISYTVELPIGNYNGVNGIKAEFKGDPNKNPYAGSEDSNNLQVIGSQCTSPNISSEPSWQSITYGENASFSVVASGDALAYQWQVDTGSGFQNLSDNLFYSNTSTATLQITKPSVSFTESQYRVVVSNSCGTVYSGAAGLQVKAKDITGIFTVSDKTYDTNNSASITSISLTGVVPEDQVIISGGTANFSDPNAETNKAVFLTGAQLSGAHAVNYKLLSVSTATATIFKAISTTTVTINGGPFTYSNAPIEPATVTVTGVGLNLSPTATYSDNITAGTATASYSYDGDDNHFPSSDSKTFNIGKADAAISVVGYSGIYDAQAHGASGSAKDLSGNDLAGLDLGASFTNVPGGIANWTFKDVTGNYNDASGSVEIAIQKAPLTITAIDKDKTYDGVPFAGGNGVNYAGFVNNETELLLDGLLSFGGSSQGSVDFGVYEIIPQGLTSVNYDLHFISGTLKINKAKLTVSATNLSKYCGQDNPKLIMEYSGFVNQESEAVLDSKPVISTTATWESTGWSYPITVSGGSDNNYDFNYVNGELTINSISIDASSSSTPVQLGSNAVLQANVLPAVPGVRVSFYLNENWKGEALTNEQGMAALSVAGLPADVYIVKAVAGSGCDQSEAYLPVYDPNGGFVTGGGWIDSPANAMESGVTGKANFGFNAKYKSGKNNTTEVDGNTNFQFKAGDLNFSSSSHTAMSLVISGAKATYTGEGTINGLGNYEFRLIAIDGDLLGNTADKFRIKIWEKGVPSNVVYDNRRGASEAADDASLLGGGSIVIHKPKGNKESESLSKPIAITKTPIEIRMINNLEIAPNPVYDRAEIRVSMLQDAFVKIKLFDLSGRMVRDIYSGKISAGMEQIINFEKSNLMSGMYILKVYSENGQTMEKQIVIK